MRKAYRILLSVCCICTAGHEGFAAESGMTEKPAIPANMTIISSQDIVNSGASDLGELLEDYAAVTVARYGDLGALSSVSIRGSTAEQVLILIDGRPVNDTAFGTPLPNQLLLKNVERIEIIRGGAAAPYGAHAIGGIINIITRTPESSVPLTDIGARYESPDKRLYNLGFELKKKYVELYIMGDRWSSDGFRKNEDLSLDHVFMHVGFDLHRFGTLALKGDFFKNKIGIPGPNTTPADRWNDVLEKETSTPDDRQNTDSRYGLIEYTVDQETIGRIRARFFGNIDEKEFFFSNALLDQLNENKTLGAELQIDTPFGFTLGGDYRRDWLFQKLLGTGRQIENRRFFNRAVYAQHQIAGFNTTVIPGIRVDNHSVYDAETNPYLSVVHRLSDNWAVSGNAARSFRTPSFNEIIVNPSISPETGRSYDIGIQRTRDRSSFKITLFLTDTKDLILWEPDILTLSWRPVNVPATVRSRGIEYMLTKEMFGWMKHRIGYINNTVANTDTGNSISYKPKYKATYKLELFNNTGTRFIFKLRSIAKQYTSPATTSTIPGYTIVDLRFSQEMHTFTLAIGLDNASDKRYLDREGFPLSGKSYYGTISVKFLN